MQARAGLAVAAAITASLVVTSLAGALSLGTHSGGKWSGLIAFVRADGVYVMRADGSGVRPLRRGGVARGALELAWSPDGTKLAFVSRSSTRGGIWVMDADGTHLTRLVAAASALTPLSPTWSPDGRRIAFTRRGYDDRDIWVMNADGSHQRRLARTPRRFEFEVDWSPTGGRIAFSDVAGLAPYVGVMNTNGRNLRALTPRFAVFSASPQWSPDGRRIAFGLWREPLRNEELYVSDPAGRSQTRLTHNNGPDGHPAWSPDGRKIAFVRWTAETPYVCIGVPPAGCGPSDIYVINADGTGLTRLTHTRAAEGSPVWRPVAAARAGR